MKRRLTFREGTFNANSVRLVLELIGSLDLNDCTIVDIGCGRGGNTAIVAEKFSGQVIGIDMSSEAIAFCRKAHTSNPIDFRVGNALNIPLADDVLRRHHQRGVVTFIWQPTEISE